MDSVLSPDFRPTQGKGAATVLERIGNTPLAHLEGVWCKLEFLNPSGSIKARIAKHIIERAEEAGQLRPGDTIVEASSGNTGNAMAMVAAVKGYRMLVVQPVGISSERLALSRALGAEVMEVGDFHVNEALARAQELGETEGYFCPRQFASEWNVEENRTWLGPEILHQLPEGAVPDAVVAGIGTGGTLVGLGQAFRAVNPDCLVVGVEPTESRTIATGAVGRHQIEGISDGFVPQILQDHRDEVDYLLAVPSAEAVSEMRRIAQQHGCFVGPSSGAHLLAAKKLQRDRPELKTVVTLFCDGGEKYFSEHFLSAAVQGSESGG
ncbi:pyridoxal-5-phosphate-dependent protein subunit beta [Thiohalorhabdus denitrificans]|uniref:cysteine synthase n=1 Tax=Thiohalorhabdus denitrificans TaxID=381306 RepID=A0A0P9GGD3_9GAMM|nr:cysteine synthase family protein [Thiohalorhabdus denitrificans]KPV39080.1 pyridoxal-5-phosphate-dependent protein subunit beta [Thiohalorhabdus denitrificans]SCX78189.1 cysteine synthase A [Thiohalorhabdus denitrificans]